jgi:hypothetical protein
MDRDLTVKEYSELFKQKQNDAKSKRAGEYETLENFDNLGTGVDTVLKNLVWFRHAEIPDPLKQIFENGHCNLGQWFKVAMKDVDTTSLPTSVIKHLEKYKSSVGYTNIT